MSTSTALRRVTIVAPKTRVDVSLPAHSTVVELVAQLVRLCGAEPEQPSAPTGWELGRLGGAGLEPSVTVEAAGVRDGEVLYLRPRERRLAPLLFDDAIDAIASAADHQPGVWRPVLSRRVGLAFAGGIFAGFAVLIGAAGPLNLLTPLLTGGLALLLLLGGGALARAYGDAASGAVIAAGGLPAVFIAGGQFFGDSRLNPLHPGMAQLAVGCAAAALYAALAAVLVVRHSAWFVGTATAALIGSATTMITIVSGASARSAAAVAVVLAIAVSPLLPTLSLRLARLPLPKVPSDTEAFRRDEEPTLLGSRVAQDTRTAIEMLTALLAATAAIVVAGVIVLLRDHTIWTLLLAAAAGLAQVLRARAHRAAGPRFALLTAGTIVLAAASVRLVLDGGPITLLLVGAAVLLVAVGCTIYAVRALDRTASPYWSRALDIVEFVALITLLPVAGVVLDLYAGVRGLGG